MSVVARMWWTHPTCHTMYLLEAACFANPSKIAYYFYARTYMCIATLHGVCCVLKYQQGRDVTDDSDAERSCSVFVRHNNTRTPWKKIITPLYTRCPTVEHNKT